MSGGAVIVIIDPHRPRDPSADGPDGFAQELARTSPYDEAVQAIREAEAAGCRIRIIGD